MIYVTIGGSAILLNIIRVDVLYHDNIRPDGHAPNIDLDEVSSKYFIKTYLSINDNKDNFLENYLENLLENNIKFNFILKIKN